MATEILWHGHANFQLSCGNVSVLIDPFFDGNPVCGTSWRNGPKPSLVLITHDHGDHVGDAVQICRATGALCGCVYDTAISLVDRGLPQHVLGFMGNIGGSAEVAGVGLTLTPAVHTSETGAPAGFVVRMPDGCTIYHAGDTALFGDMALIGAYHDIDVALLPIGDVFTMNAVQAAHACTLLRPKAAVPMHWGTFPPLVQSPDGFVAALAEKHPATRAIVLQPGQSVTI